MVNFVLGVSAINFKKFRLMMTRMETIEQGIVIESAGVVREGLLEEVTSELRPEGRGVLLQRLFQAGGTVRAKAVRWEAA